MNRTERLYRIDQLISEHGVISRQALLAALEVSPATLKRDLEYLRSRLNAPIVWDRDAGGYRFESAAHTPGPQYELPGLWFSDKEIHALLTMQHLLANLDAGGILAPHVQPLMARLNTLLGTADNPAEQVRRRVVITGVGQRQLGLEHFERIGSALLQRTRVRITYFARSHGRLSEREISPQRLVHYRENWYLDAWCHLRGDIRSFAVDSIRRVMTLETPAREIDPAELDAHVGPGYGIFQGRRVQWAQLRFSAERSRWVTSEQWHPRQKGIHLADGGYLLALPFADHRELIMDILKHGAHCRVLEPASLRQAARQEIARMQNMYAEAATGA